MRFVYRCSLLALLAAGTAHAGSARPLAAREGANLQRPKFSQDGARLSYEANFHEKKTAELYVGDPRSGSFGRVVPATRAANASLAGFSTSGSGQVAHELDWGPVGRFVYSASGPDREYDLYLGQGGALAASSGNDGGPAWSPDGKLIAFTSGRTGQGDLYLVNLQTGVEAPRRLTNDSDGSELFATWSPDSQTLAFVSHTHQGDNVWVLPIAPGSSPRRLTTWIRSQVRPVFSPDGSRVAFFADRDEPGRFDLFVSDTTGGQPVKLASDIVMNGSGPAFTPDGRFIVVVLNDDDRFDPLAIVPVDGSHKARAIDFGTVGHGDLDVTRTGDGKVWIAFIAQGQVTDTKRVFDRLFIAELPKSP